MTDTAGTLPALAVLCARRGLHEDVAAHVGWWLDRADFPAGRAVVDVVAACQGRWVTGLPPQAEQSAGVWREWVGVLPDVAAMAEDDVFAWQLAQRAAEDGRDWRVPDRPARAAAGLRARCDAADLYAAALLTDPIWQARAVHTGHATVGEFAGTAGVRPRRGTVIARRLDSRLRPGKVIAGHAGEPGASGAPFAATVDGTRVEDGRLVLTLTGVTGTVSDGVVTLLEAPPNVWSQRRSRMTYGALYKRRSSWLSTGRTPPVAAGRAAGGARRRGRPGRREDDTVRTLRKPVPSPSPPEVGGRAPPQAVTGLNGPPRRGKHPYGGRGRSWTTRRQRPCCTRCGRVTRS